MELKLSSRRGFPSTRRCLNRTFYGIETTERGEWNGDTYPVLIVPFMELKQAFAE